MPVHVMFWIDHDGQHVICAKHKLEDLLVIPRVNDKVRVTNKEGIEGEWRRVLDVTHDVPNRLVRVELESRGKFLSLP